MSDYVDLKDFIRETLVQIPKAISEANEELKDERPECYSYQRSVGGEEHDKIMFDIAITSQKDTKGGGNIGFKICVFSGDATDKVTKKHTNVSRVQFYVSKNPIKIEL
jgi:hypothetical protein